MAEDTSVKYYSWDMLRSLKLQANVTTSVRDLLAACLVDGFGSVSVLSGSVIAGKCRMLVASGNSFSFNSTVFVTGCDQSAANGEHKITSMGDTFFEFNTELPDGAITGATIIAKYAGAGWELPFGTNATTSVFRSLNTAPTSHRHYLQVKETSNTELRVTAYHSMTDLNNGGVFYPPTSVITGGYYWSKSYFNDTRSIKWWIIASSTFFYYIVQPYDNGLGINNFPSVSYFGDFINGLPTDNLNTALVGKFNSNESTYTTSANGRYYEFGCNSTNKPGWNNLAGTIDNNNAPITFAMFADVTGPLNDQGYSSRGYFQKRSQKDGSIELTKYKTLDNQGYERGEIPGALFVKSGLGRDNPPFSITDGFGDLAGKKLLGIYTVAGGELYYYYNIYSYSSAFIFIDITGPWE